MSRGTIRSRAEEYRREYTNLNNTTMREFFKKLMSNDENNMKFTKYEMVMYGIVLPVGLVLLMGIAGWLETCSEAIAAQ